VFGVSLFLEACLDVQELLVDCKPGHLEWKTAYESRLCVWFVGEQVRPVELSPLSKFLLRFGAHWVWRKSQVFYYAEKFLI
jgi:hypothetical protein